MLDARVSHEDFLDDELRQAAIMRQLEIIGEATGRMTPEFLRDLADVLPRTVMSWKACTMCSFMGTMRSTLKLCG